jgi:hypothetical protein
VNKRTAHATVIANQAIAVLQKRGELYDNDNIQNDAHTVIMQILYPNGLPNIYNEVARYKFISQIVDKLCRYRLNGFQDNLIDLANYAFLLAAFDEEKS